MTTPEGTAMRGMIASLPGQLRWAADADVVGPALDAHEVLVCGMGGSGIAGDVARVVSDRRVTVHKDYGLPAWAGDARPLVAVVSYSGATEESLDALATALEWGLDVVTVSTDATPGGSRAHLQVPGGLQPRAAIGHLAGGLLRLLHAVGAAADPRPGLAEAESVVAELLGRGLDGTAVPLARDLAAELAGRIALVHGSEGLTGVAAYRWKCQIHENAKAPAVASLLPELDHNELAGWRGAPAEARWAVVALRDEHEHPRVALRYALTRELAPVPTVGEVWSQGDGALARVLSLTTVGDLVSLFLAEYDDVDPVQVDVLTTLKRRLGDVPR